MDSRQLRYFLAVVDHGGFTRAAEALYVAQPTLTQAMRNLERELGGRLFDRVGRGVVVSSAGRALIGPARRVEADLAAMDIAVRRTVELRSGWLDLAVSPDLALDPAVGLITTFRARHPAVVVNVHAPDGTSSVAELLRRGECEVAISLLPVNAPGAHTRSLGARTIVLVSPAGGVAHWSHAGQDSPPLICGPRGTPVREQLEAAAREAGTTLRVDVEMRREERIPELVAAGAGAAFLAPRAAERAVALGAVRVPNAPKLTQKIGLIHDPGSLTPGARAFVQVAAELAADPASTGIDSDGLDGAQELRIGPPSRSGC